MKVSILFFLFCTCFALSSVLASVAKEPIQFEKEPEWTDLSQTIVDLKSSEGWEPLFAEGGMTGFKRPEKESPVDAVKGYGVVATSFEKLASIIIDEKKGPDWIEALALSKSVGGTFPVDYVEFNHFRTPFILNDREFLSRVRMKIDKKNRAVGYFFTPTDFSYPVTRPRVRGELTRSVIVVMADPKSPAQSIVLVEFHGDPKGNIPKWLVNWFQHSWPKDTLKGLRREAARYAGPIHPVIQRIFDQKSSAQVLSE